MSDENRREIINPHDRMTIDYSDPQAAQLAVLIVGDGRYGIDGDDGLGLFLFGGIGNWVMEKYGMDTSTWFDSIAKQRIINALRSWRLEGERSSMSDPTAAARRIADKMEAE